VRVDVHQHVWTVPLLEALGRRECLPFARRADSLWVVYLAGEMPTAIDLVSEQPERRSATLVRDGVDQAIVAISSPLGIERLPRSESLGLFAAHLDGVEAFGSAFRAWGPLPLDAPSSADVDAVLARGCVGVSLPAGALTPPSALDSIRPALARAEQRDVPLFIHPGPGLAERGPEPSLRDPLWWAALTRYVAQMQAAWLSFMTVARRDFPGLRVVFAMLAGGAPLHSERLLARGGPAIDLESSLCFYDTSSYGPVAIEAMADLVGVEQLLYGSDRPVIEPVPYGRNQQLAENAGRLTFSSGVLA
jgi:hypothetical protein